MLTAEYRDGFSTGELLAEGKDRTQLKALWDRKVKGGESRSEYPGWTLAQIHRFRNGMAAAIRAAYKNAKE